MGIVKQNIHSLWNNDNKTLIFHDNGGLTLDPFYYKEYKNFLTPEECKTLARIILEEEERILNIPNDSQKPYEGLTKQHTVYNWFNHPKVSFLNIPQRLAELPEFNTWKCYLMQCWTNILRQGENLNKHAHTYQPPNHLYACNIFIQGDTRTGTHYYAAGGYTPNGVGTLTIVGQEHEHEVKTNIYQTPRISMAVDVMTKPYFMQRNERFTERYVCYKNDAVLEKPLCMQL